MTARWGIIDQLDFLKESGFVTDFTDAFTTVATRAAHPLRWIRLTLPSGHADLDAAIHTQGPHLLPGNP
ncbi:hypothetical protein [Streptosporangium sp. NPDC000396]|uniref:hypothetical protein n=1 Tax=Streptosporangium sp. NPDC000396 TaxID=3366185 RepID=UPI0036A16978